MIRRASLLLISIIFAQFSYSQFSWEAQNSTVPSAIEAFDFLPDNVKGFAVTDDGEILKTTNQGVDWTVVYQIPIESTWTLSNWCKAVVYRSTSEIMVVCHFGMVWTSIDDGLNWSEIHNGPNTDYIQDASESVGRIVISRSSDVLFTDDFGVDWDSSAVTGFSSGIRGIDFDAGGSGYGVVVSGTGNIAVSTDHGDNWTTLGTSPASSLNDVYVFSAGNFIVIGDLGYMFKTSNGGGNWTQINNGVPIEDLWCIDFGNATTGLLGGANGTLLETFDGGDSWGPATGVSATALFKSVKALNSFKAFAGGNGGEIYKSPLENYNLTIVEYQGPDTTCHGTPFDFSFKVINDGPGEAIDPMFSILIGTEDVFGYAVSLPGSIPPLDSTVFTISVVHDKDPNGLGWQPVTIYSTIGSPPTIIGFFVNGDSIFFVDPDPHTVTGSQNFCPGDTLSIEATGGSSYFWPNIDGGVNGAQQTVYPTMDTDYAVEISQPFCVVTDSVSVLLDLGCVVDTTMIDSTIILESYAFSPNADNVNDFLVLDFLDDDLLNEVTIYNRWGDEVFHTAAYDNDQNSWDGTFGSRRAPAGTYFFIAETSANGVVRGWVQLVR